MGAIRFGVPKELVAWLQEKFQINVFVETGTNRGETAVWASTLFERVFTIEADEVLHQRALDAYGHHKNVRFLKGDSRDQIELLLTSLREPAIFWLDAHWCGQETFGKTDECPVVGELELLNASKIEHIVLIDDARLFLAPPPPPHETSHWPDIITMCGLLSTSEKRRFVVVYDDVIIGVPDSARFQITEFLRRESSEVGSSPVTAVVRRSPLRWTRSILKRHFQ